MYFVKSSFYDHTEFVKMEMSTSERNFAAAALAVFQRYGVRKATMEEIAAEAGVSKPTLYATFRNKDAALGGAIRLAKNAQLTAAQEAWTAAPTLSDQLDIFLDQLVLTGFDMLHNAPDAAAFENAVGEASAEAITVTRETEIDAVRALFDGQRMLATHGLDAAGFARFFVDAAMNAKRLAQTRAELEDHLRTLKATALGLVNEG
ncbi:MAG: helix-turn-helix domain-containing protein [Pseudomonadota bacterium]